MCGIFCSLSDFSPHCETKLNDIYLPFEKLISNRGPDFLSSHIYCKNNEHCILFGASVLWLQGTNITEQPLVTDKSVLLFNGDIFDGGAAFQNKEVVGDTKLLLDNLENSECASDVLSLLQGPYAFIYLNKSRSKLYFGRDIFGRRSLLIGKNGNDLILTSVATKCSNFLFTELPSLGVFSLDLKLRTFELFPWHYRLNERFNEFQTFLGRDICITVSDSEPVAESILHEPSESDLEIFRKIKDFEIDEGFKTLLNNKNWLNNVSVLKKLLEESVGTRVNTQPKYCHKCISSLTSDCSRTLNSDCSHALTGVLFSGGVDCAIIALLIDQFTETNRPIDLFNVAFDRGKGYKTPDRVTGLQTLEELKIICPNRQWNFVEINVPVEELNFERKNHISHLIYPLNTILDDSLGCALWFAARGRNNDYQSSCRIIFTGMGADELFGGYTRHRATLRKEGWAGLHEALDAEWQNIPYRNLGRDDRVVSDSGRQLRLPYLDEKVVSFVRRLNSWEKTCPSSDLPQGFGEKILLRSLAYHLGLENASNFKKRALQFGSRIANPKENAHEVSNRL